MDTKQKCPQCKRQINLDKPYTLFQRFRNKVAMDYAKKCMGNEMPKDFPEMKDYYCDCGLHITFVKEGTKWVWVTAS